MQKKSFTVEFGLIIQGVAVMLLVLRAALLLTVASLLPPSRTEPAVSQKPPKQRAVKLFLDPSVLKKVPSQSTPTTAPPEQRTVKLFLDPSVLKKDPSQSTSTTAKMSLSPWTYRDSFVASRIPRWISQAECLTSSCLDPRGGEELTDLQARPIKYQVLVLHKVPRQNLPARRRRRQKKYELRLGTEEITVGCTCVRPTVLVQQ